MKKRVVYGLPITPVRLLDEVKGESYCVSYATRDRLTTQLDQAIAAVGDDSILLVDNGAFSAWRSGVPLDVEGFAVWAADILAKCPQAVAVVPDVIDGDAAANDEMLVEFSGVCYELGLDVPHDRRMAVWHMHEPLERLTGLIESCFMYIAIGSSGEYAKTGTPQWHERIQAAMKAIDDFCAESDGAYRRPWIHMMRAQAEAHRYEFDSSDSCNLAINHSRYKAEGEGYVARFAERIASKIDASCDGSERPTIEPPSVEATRAAEWLARYRELRAANIADTHDPRYGDGGDETHGNGVQQHGSTLCPLPDSQSNPARGYWACRRGRRNLDRRYELRRRRSQILRTEPRAADGQYSLVSARGKVSSGMA